jgi:uncharacterized membrane protein YdjX (TVP38/TMEM64 family)
MTVRRIAVAVLLLAAIVAVALDLPIVEWSAGVAEWAQRHRAAAGTLFVAGYVVAAVLLVPGSILTLAAGFVFGLPLGAALASAGSVLGAAAAFAVGRAVARDCSWIAMLPITVIYVYTGSLAKSLATLLSVRAPSGAA